MLRAMRAVSSMREVTAQFPPARRQQRDCAAVSSAPIWRFIASLSIALCYLRFVDVYGDELRATICARDAVDLIACAAARATAPCAPVRGVYSARQPRAAQNSAYLMRVDAMLAMRVTSRP